MQVGMTSNRPSVAVIGCGPAAMFFLHAVASRRQRLQEAGDRGLESIPEVTCFEQASAPGGVWRSPSDAISRNGCWTSKIGTVYQFSSGLPKPMPSNKSGRESPETEQLTKLPDTSPTIVYGISKVQESQEVGNAKVTPEERTTNMYEALWINSNKDTVEFSDYTFLDHFGEKPLPVYLRRKQVLDYMLARVTSVQDIFKDVSFQTTVTSVTFDKTANKFLVTVTDKTNDQSQVFHFDKCIWCGGANGDKKVPTGQVRLLKRKHFLGDVLHSTEMQDFEQKVRGKDIVFIGDSYSAEDLALQSLKLGCNKVHIISRSGQGEANSTGYWPGGKVQVYQHYKLDGVMPDGRGLKFAPLDCENPFDDDYCQPIEDAEPMVLENISTVVFCTGYKPNASFLEPNLLPKYLRGGNTEYSFQAPDGWKMKPNQLTSALGDVQPCETLWADEGYIPKTDLYRKILISNPSMMFLFESSDFPLLDLDVNAWYLTSYICGDIQLPSKAEIKRWNYQGLLEEMNVPEHRYQMDENYYKAWGEMPNDVRKEFSFEEAKAMTKDGELPKPVWVKSYGEEVSHYIRCLARDMADSNYPISLGTFEELNERGQKLVDMTVALAIEKWSLHKGSVDSEWRTFRDVDPSSFSSVYTGMPSAALDGRWIDVPDGES